MFVPKLYRNTNREEIFEFISKNNFGILISTNESKRIIATHIPFIIKEKEAKLYASSHISKSNEQWENIEQLKEVMIIFQGAHTYISSSWYDHINVPTWDYVVVHLYGIARILNENEVIKHLNDLVNKHEVFENNPVSLKSMTDEYVRKEMKGLVAFEIEVAEVFSAFKLSQNRDIKNLEQIIYQLEMRNDENSLAIADALRNIKKQKINDKEN